MAHIAIPLMWCSHFQSLLFSLYKLTLYSVPKTKQSFMWQDHHHHVFLLQRHLYSQRTLHQPWYNVTVSSEGLASTSVKLLKMLDAARWQIEWWGIISILHMISLSCDKHGSAFWLLCDMSGIVIFLHKQLIYPFKHKYWGKECKQICDSADIRIYRVRPERYLLWYNDNFLHGISENSNHFTLQGSANFWSYIHCSWHYSTFNFLGHLLLCWEIKAKETSSFCGKSGLFVAIRIWKNCK